MKTFKSYRNEDLINEKILRPAAVLSLAAKSRASGNKAEIFYRRGLDATKQIHRGMPEQEIPIRIAAVLRQLLLGNIYRRKQQGDAVGIDVIGHLSTKKKR